MYKYSYGSSRGKKVWINAFKEVKRSSRGDISEYVIASIELNVVDNDHKIIWINVRNEKDNYYDLKDLPEEHKVDFIKESIEFADNNGYLDRFNNKNK